MVFLFCLLVILILILFVFTSKIETKIINLRIDSQSAKHINDKYEIIIKLKVFGRIPVVKITLTQSKLKKIYENLKMKEKIIKFEEEIYQNKDKIDLKLIDMAKEINKSIEINHLKLEVEFGTENAFLTAMLVTIIASIFSIVISRKSIKENQILYNIKPIYSNQNLIKIVISGIFKIKVIHIINIIYVLNKKGGIKKYERTSNRRSYDYSYE